MENIVKNVYTAYRIDNTTGYGHYISVKGAKFSGKCFGFDLWFHTDGDCSVLVSQEGGFSLGIVQNKIVLKIEGKTLSIRSDILEIPEHEWVNLYMGFDDGQISVLINGNIFGSTSYSGNIRNDNDFLLGKEFTGYIRSFRLYSAVLDEQAFRRYFMQTEYKADSMSELIGFIDMTQKQMPDLSGKGVSADSSAGCTFMDLVDIYCPGDGGVVSFSEPEEINPGGFASGKFSVYVKLYIRPGGTGRQILFTNGAPGCDDSITVYCDKTGNKTAFVFQYGKEEICLDSKEPDYSWVDVIVCADGKSLSAYINHTAYQKTVPEALARKKAGDFRIGGYQKNTGMLCQNYIHTVAIFDEVLTEKDAADFMNNHPFILEDDLVALVSFEGGMAWELADGTGITAGQEGLFPAQRTVEKLPSEPYQFRVNYTKDAASDMKQWQAEQIVTSYTDFGTTMTGCACCVPGATVTALVNYVSHHEKLLQSAWELYSKAKIGSDEAVGAMSSLEKAAAKGLTKALQFSAGTTAAAGAGAAVGEAAVLGSLAEYAGLFALGSAAVVISAAIIVSDINEIHKDKPDEEDKEDISVKLLSITFQHSPDQYGVSAVRCRNQKGTITGPEWTCENHCVAPAVYIADHLDKVKIKVKYRITDNSKVKAGTYSIDFSGTVMQGEEKLFDQFTYKAQAQKDGVDYEVEMESSVKACVAQEIQFTQVKLWWDCRVNGKFLSLPNTLSDLYILPRVPDTPILLEKGCDEYFPAIEYLEIYTKLLSTQEMKGENAVRINVGYSQAQLRQLTQLIFFAPCFQYYGAPTPQYVLRQMDGGAVVLKFKENNFFNDVEAYARGQRGPMEIECEVYAAVLGYYLNILGIPFRLVYIINPEEGEILHTQPVYPAGHLGEPPVAKQFEYHVAVEVAARVEQGVEIPAGIYDASMGTMQGGEIRPITALPFQGIEGARVNVAQEAGTYRGTVMQDQTGAMISGEYVFVIDNGPD